MEVLQQIEQIGVLVWVREGGSILGYPLVLFLHTLGLGTIAGLNGVIDLRILGVAPQIRLAPLVRLFPIIWLAFAVTALSGTTLLLAAATTKLVSPVFYVKMVFVALALVNLHLLKTRVLTRAGVDTEPLGSGARVLAISSLVLWCAATMAGRLMAYLG
jgi:hypothetical protein